VVILTEALSLVSALKSQHSNALSDLTDSLESLTKFFQKVAIQWEPAHCEIAGNEEADKLTKQGGPYNKKTKGQRMKLQKQ
jgi:ribonuclease HI